MTITSKTAVGCSLTVNSIYSCSIIAVTDSASMELIRFKVNLKHERPIVPTGEAYIYEFISYKIYSITLSICKLSTLKTGSYLPAKSLSVRSKTGLSRGFILRQAQNHGRILQSVQVRYGEAISVSKLTPCCSR